MDEDTRKSLAELFALLREVQKDVSEIKIELATATANHEAEKRRLEKVEETVESHEKIVNKGFGIIAVVGVVTGLLGHWIVAAAKKLLALGGAS